MSELEGKVAVVTGGGSGIGKAVAKSLAREGVRVAVLGRRDDKLKEVASDIIGSGGSATYAACDVRSAESIKGAADHVRAEFDGRVDILVNNAGVYDGSLLENTSEEEWDSVIDTNLKGPFLVTKAFLPTMKARGGWIVNMASWAGKDVAAGGSTYAASKWGLRGWSECLGQELREHGIRVAAIYPGSVNTAMGRGVPGALEPADVADSLLYLLRLPERAYVDDITIVPTEYY